jgi:hypothetical protein
MPDIITAAGPIGTATTTPVITYDAKGRLTAVTTVATAPPFSAVTGQTTLAQLPTLTANTVLANPSAISATPVAHAVPNCVTSAGFPNALNWTAGGGFSCGVVSINPSTFATIAQYYAGTSTNTIITPSIIYPAEVSIAWGASIALDFSTFINSVITHTGSMTITATGVIAGKAGMIRFIQSGGGASVVVWPTQFKWPAGAVKTLSGQNNNVDVLSYNCSTTTFCTVALLKDVQ